MQVAGKRRALNSLIVIQVYFHCDSIPRRIMFLLVSNLIECQFTFGRFVSGFVLVIGGSIIQKKKKNKVYFLNTKLLFTFLSIFVCPLLEFHTTQIHALQRIKLRSIQVVIDFLQRLLFCTPLSILTYPTLGDGNGTGT